MDHIAKKLVSAIESLPSEQVFGKVSKILGMLVEVEGSDTFMTIGSRCLLKPPGKEDILCEVVGFNQSKALLMPYGSLTGVGMGCPAYVVQSEAIIHPDASWLGRVINGLGKPIDGKGILQWGATPVEIKRSPPPAHDRGRVGQRLELGVRAMNTFLSTCRGQRMGIFAGSGVGKSVLLSMLAKYSKADVSVIGLIGERGREVQEFIQDDLGEEGLKNSIVIVATSDEPPLVRRQAAYLTLAIAEYFRDQGKEVLCLMDSVTRFAMAQREIGLSVGEPPTSKGYPPTTFTELARLLERAGPGLKGAGNITGLFSVLVEGDDQNEPIADAVRGILDGHIVMDRRIADRGRYPAIDVLKSVSRTIPDCLEKHEYELLRHAKSIVSTYEDMEELIRLGAYRKGTDPKVDEAIMLYPKIEAFLNQNKSEKTPMPECYAMLQDILSPAPKPPTDASAENAILTQPKIRR